MCHQKEWSIRRSVDRTVSIASFVISCHATPHAQMLKLRLIFDWLLQHLGCWWDRYANGMVQWTGLLSVLCNSLSSKIFSNIMVLACLWSRSRFGSDWRMQRLHGLKSMNDQLLAIIVTSITDKISRNPSYQICHCDNIYKVVQRQLMSQHDWSRNLLPHEQQYECCNIIIVFNSNTSNFPWEQTKLTDST